MVDVESEVRLVGMDLKPELRVMPLDLVQIMVLRDGQVVYARDSARVGQ